MSKWQLKFVLNYWLTLTNLQTWPSVSYSLWLGYITARRTIIIIIHTTQTEQDMGPGLLGRNPNWGYHPMHGELLICLIWFSADPRLNLTLVIKNVENRRAAGWVWVDIMCFLVNTSMFVRQTSPGGVCLYQLYRNICISYVSKTILILDDVTTPYLWRWSIQLQTYFILLFTVRRKCVSFGGSWMVQKLD